VIKNSSAPRRLSVVLATLMISTAGYAADGSLIGVWRNPEQGGLIDVTRCGDGLCGRIIDGAPGAENYDVYNKDATLRQRPLKGLVLFSGLIGGPPAWTGEVYNPSDGGTYHGTLSLVSSQELRLTGCIIWPLCRSQIWTRFVEP
jgi:uncharacterized protein (DUF2147 family)